MKPAGLYFGAVMITSDWHKKVYRKNIKKQMKSKMDEWYKLRMACLKRNHFTCQRCDKKNGQGRGMTAHHIIPRSEEGADDLSNLITLCDPCHDYVEINELRSIAEITGSYEDTVEVSVPKPTEQENEEGYHFKRPAWHKWVYGSGKNPKNENK
jgi:HNH endonuclease